MHHLSSRPHPLWLFEENYRLLHSLLPQLENAANHVLGKGIFALHVAVEAMGPYTLSARISAQLGGKDSLPPPLYLEARIYRDARLVEVTGYQNCRNIPPRYLAKQSRGHVRDERYQVNRLLYELLHHYHRHGHVKVVAG